MSAVHSASCALGQFSCRLVHVVAYTQVFERRLTDNIRALDFHKILDPANVRRIVEEADGYQPHLIAPEMGYRRLLQECLVLFKGPAEVAVDEVRLQG